MELVNPSSLAPPVGFAHASVAGDLVWVGGQISSDENGNVLYPGDLPRQFARALRNVRVALESAGSNPSSVVKVTYFVTDAAAYRRSASELGALYREVFGKHYPAASLLQVSSLFEPAALIEIECVALRNGAGDRDDR